MGSQNQANNRGNNQSQEDLLKQQQFMQAMQQQYMKQQMLNNVQGIIQTLDKKTILDTLNKYCGQYINCMGNPMLSQQLNLKLLELLNADDADGFIVSAQQALLYAVNITNNLKSQMMYSGMGGMNSQFNQFGMNPMMNGMGMQMPGMMGGMNPMMGNMNPMMNGMCMQMPGMMGGMNPMMGNAYGYQNQQFSNPQNQNTAEMTEEEKEANKIKIARQYINQNIYASDPIIYLQCLSTNGGLVINIDNDKQLEYLIANAIYTGICSLSNNNNEMFRQACYLLQQLYYSDYYSKMNKNNGNGNQQQNQQFNQFGMNPMMNGMGMQMPGMMGGMNPMMGNMNPMMNGMGMQMPGMMSGMDYQMNMGGLGMGPMMNQGMNMMGGMTGGMGMQMPGMNAGTSTSNCMFN